MTTTPRTGKTTIINLGVSGDKYRQLETELAQAHSENEEQGRLLDMSATREAKHLAMLDQLQRDLTRRDTLIERILDYPYLPQNLATIIRKELDTK